MHDSPVYLESYSNLELMFVIPVLRNYNSRLAFFPGDDVFVLSLPLASNLINEDMRLPENELHPLDFVDYIMVHAF